MVASTSACALAFCATSRPSGSSMRLASPRPDGRKRSNMRERVSTDSLRDCSSEVINIPERPSSPSSPVWLSKSATATVIGAPRSKSASARGASSASRSAATAATATLFRLTSRQSRRNFPGGRALTGSPASEALRSSASARALGYRRVGSFSRHLRTMLSTSGGNAGSCDRGETGSSLSIL